MVNNCVKIDQSSTGQSVLADITGSWNRYKSVLGIFLLVHYQLTPLTVFALLVRWSLKFH